MHDGGGKIYVRETQGVYTTRRWACIWITQLIFYGLPWLNWGPRQMVLFDLAAGKFYLFGAVLWPQDGIYFSALLIMCCAALFLSGALGGRVWCGFACPHTVYTELFMWIERKIEGGRSARIRLDQGAPSFDKLARKALKHGVWLGAAGWTGFTLVGYFTPMRALSAALLSAAAGPWEVFWIALYGLLTYGNAGWMRAQFCRHICPPARFQSAMSGSDTLVVTYDAARGEPRGLRNRKQPAQQRRGDCVDCTLCIQVCPTGSDIRQGFHADCIGCGACIDACDLVMDKIGAARGLILYASEHALPAAPRPRILLYGLALLAMAGAWAGAVALRPPFRVNVIHDRGVLQRQVADGMIENVYRLQVMNADEGPHRYRISVAGVDTIALAGPDQFTLDGLAARALPLRVRAAAGRAGAGSHPIVFDIRELEGGQARVTEQAVFLMPP